MTQQPPKAETALPGSPLAGHRATEGIQSRLLGATKQIRAGRTCEHLGSVDQRRNAIDRAELESAKLGGQPAGCYRGVTWNFAETGPDQGVDDGGPSVWARWGSRARAIRQALAWSEIGPA